MFYHGSLNNWYTILNVCFLLFSCYTFIYQTNYWFWCSFDLDVRWFLDVCDSGWLRFLYSGLLIGWDFCTADSDWLRFLYSALWLVEISVQLAVRVQCIIISHFSKKRTNLYEYETSVLILTLFFRHFWTEVYTFLT